MLKLSLLVCFLFVSMAALFVSMAAQSPAPTKKAPSKEGRAFLYTRKSIAQGKQFYLIHCVECHDQDGRGLGRRDFSGAPPADLTDPDAWLYGTSPSQIFSSIRDGIKEDMPPFKGKLSDEQVSNVVNFVRSLWPEAKRPKLEPDTDSGRKGLSWISKNHAQP